MFAGGGGGGGGGEKLLEIDTLRLLHNCRNLKENGDKEGILASFDHQY